MDQKKEEKEANSFNNTCSLFFKGSLKTSNEDELLTYDLLWFDPDFIELYNTWEPSTKSKLSVLEAFWAKFDSTYREQVPQLTYRFNLRNLTQGEDEKLMVFIK